MKKWAVLAWFLAGPALAADESSYMMVLSIGVNSCGKYTASDTQTKEMYLGWTLGFVTGANFNDIGPRRQAGDGWDRDSLLAFLDLHCTQNPLDTFITAAVKYRDEMMKRTAQ